MKILFVAIAIFMCSAFTPRPKVAQPLMAPTAGVFLFINTVTANGSLAMGHTNEVALLSTSLGVATDLSVQGTPGPPSLADVSFVKLIDISSLRLKEKIFRGQTISSAEIRYYNGVDNNPVYVVTLTNSIVTSISDSEGEGCAGGCPGITESYSFSYRIISFTNNKTSPAQVLTYNVGTRVTTSSGL